VKVIVDLAIEKPEIFPPERPQEVDMIHFRAPNLLFHPLPGGILLPSFSLCHLLHHDQYRFHVSIFLIFTPYQDRIDMERSQY
jgi:hypothetical protein